MVSDVIIVLLVLSNLDDALGTKENSGNQVEKNEYFDKKIPSMRKVKRWAPGFHDFAVDYPELDDPYAENQLEVARPFSTSPGSTLYYRPGPRRPSGAVTRTVFNPPSGFIPRVFAAAKAAIATLTGPQTVLSRTTYLPPPRPGITALHVPQAAVTDGGNPSTNAAAAAAAAAAAVAAVTRSIYEAAGQRGYGLYEKHNYLPPPMFNSYGLWPEPSRSPWTTLQPPEIAFRIPYEGWGDRGHHQVMETYGPPTPMWSKNHHNPTITIEAPRSPWPETNHNKVSYNYDGWANYRNQWNDYNQNHRGWVQNRVKDVWLDDKMVRTSYGRSPGGYAAATADTPPNGDSFADAKITANGASAVAATVWDFGAAGRGNENKRTKTEVRYDQDEEDFSRGGKKLGEDRRKQSGGGAVFGRMGDGDADTRRDKSPSAKCSDDDMCSFPKTNVERLRALFPSRRKS